MITIEKRRQQRKREVEEERRQRRRRQAPIIVDVVIGDVLVNIPLMDVYAPILKVAEDTRLFDMAMKYSLPLSRQQAFLVQEGDTFLPQFEKVQINDQKEDELIEQGWSPLLSSNLQAVKVVGPDLQILFHNDSVYNYPNKAEMYYPFNEALSPGRLLWRTIRTMPGYERIA